MAKKGRNVARKKRSGGAYSVSSLPKEPVPSNISPYFMGDEFPFISRTGKGGPDRVGPISAAPGTSEDTTRINLSQREGDRIQRSEYKMPSEKKPIKPKPRPDVGAIERGNRAAKRTAQDLANMEAGGLVGGQVKLDKNKDGKISGADFKMMEDGGEVKGKKRKKSKGNMCRGGGAALRGTRFSGTK
tara:strand:- start:80 stop:640 length:561 start_codon:yes stop_codon:yes gene_type:complete